MHRFSRPRAARDFTSRRSLCTPSVVLLAITTSALLPVVPIAVATAYADTVKVTVSSDDSASRASLESRGAELVAQRGNYHVYRVDASAARSPSDGSVTVRADFDRIALRRRSIDTRNAARSTDDQRRLRLVQFAAPPNDEDLAALEADGVSIVHYVPQNAYIVWAPGSSATQALRTRAAAAGNVAYESAYTAGDALSPRLDGSAAKSDLIEVTVQLFNHASVKSDLAAVTSLATSIVSNATLDPRGVYLNVRVRVSGVDLSALSEIQSVVNVEPYVRPHAMGERQGQIMAGNLDVALQNPSGPGYLAWLAGHGFSTNAADYPVLVVVDDGVDNGTTSPAASEFYELNNAANPSRILFSVIPPGSFASGPEGPDGHGNINASIVGGYNDAAGAASEDASGFNYGLGVSPYGRLANVRIFAPNFDVGTGDATMVDDYYTRGARISTNSWGADVFGDYNTDSQVYDSLTRDAQGGTGGNQEILFVFAAGNAGPGSGSVGSPGTGKNLLTVGAGETSNPDASSGDGCGDTTTDGDDARDMASFSSRGPCSDGRIKPEIAAPGTFIQGLASQPSFNGSGVCGAAGNDFSAPGTDALFPPGSIYTWSSGTSHSTPGVAGYTSLISEFLDRVHSVATPSPALIKAYVLHSGRHMSGNGANEDLPGINQGFGIPDMDLGFSVTAPRFLHDQTQVFASSGESINFLGQAPDVSEPIRVSLVWTDAPGATVGDAFVNDLDLVVTVGGNTYLGNNFSAGDSQTGGTADTRNNSESVFLPAGTTGPMTITVNATTIAGDGVPGNGDTTDQDFAIVAYNFTDASPAGFIVLDESVYGCIDVVGIAIADSDLTGTGSANISVTTSGGDSEIVALSETPANSGQFSGTIVASGDPVTTSDAVLQVADGQIVTATYNDADDGSGNPAVVQDAATVDCTAPVISAVTTAGFAATTATITFTTDETASGQVRFGTSCGALTSTSPTGAETTSHSIDLAGLASSTTYFYAADAADAAGNSATDDNIGACYSLTTLDQADYFTEFFESSDLDLTNTATLFTPNGSGDFYEACSFSVAGFPIDPAGGTTENLSDDDSNGTFLGGGNTAKLYGTAYPWVFIGSNGYVTLGTSDTDFSPSLADHFSLPRVSALFTDLNPGAGGTVSTLELADRIAITYEDVPEFSTNNSNNFQIELFYDGKIRITTLDVDATGGIVGLSAGSGVPGDFAESNLSAYSPCASAAGCPATPLAGCKVAGKAKVQVRDDGDDEKDQIKWKWLRGDATLLSDFGNPLAIASNTLCIWDQTAAVAGVPIELVIPSGLGWSGKSTSYKYKDKTGAAAGVQQLQLKSGINGKPKLSLKARGSNIPLVGPFDAGAYFDADPEISVQLINSETGICWTSEFVGLGAKNSAEQFKQNAP